MPVYQNYSNCEWIMAFVSDTANKLWTAIEMKNLEFAQRLLASAAEKGLARDVCEIEVNKIVFGRNLQRRDSVSCFHLAAKRGLPDGIALMVRYTSDLICISALDTISTNPLTNKVVSHI